MRGSSGAQFTINNDVVTKYDTAVTRNRVRDQGIWIQKYDECVSLPAVYAVHFDGYEMEKLVSTEELTGGTPIAWVDVLNLCDEIISTLDVDIWHREFTDLTVSHVRFNSEPNTLDFDDYRDYHRRYVRGLLTDTGQRRLDSTLRRFANEITWYQLKHALTHGDPIIDNVMWRVRTLGLERKSELVLIDPIPACPALPDVEAVDVGRVIQSAIGYEHVRYMTQVEINELNGTSLTERVDAILNVWLQTFNLNEARAALYCGIIHTLRGVRTAQRVAPDRVQSLLDLTSQLVRETDKWMQ